MAEDSCVRRRRLDAVKAAAEEDRRGREPGASLAVELLADHPEAAPALAEWFTREWGDADTAETRERFLAQVGERGNRDRLPICLLGFDGGAVVATATLKYREIDYSPKADFWLGSVFVREDVRGRGYARSIILAAEELALAKGFTPLFLYTPRKEGLYARLGWRTVGVTPAFGKTAAVMTKY